jgi:hypothetical protein
VENRRGAGLPVVSVGEAFDVRADLDGGDPWHVDVFEHLMHGVPLPALLAALGKFAAQSTSLGSRGVALFTVAVEAVALT